MGRKQKNSVCQNGRAYRQILWNFIRIRSVDSFPKFWEQLFQGIKFHHFCRKIDWDRLRGNLREGKCTGSEIAKDNSVRVEHRYNFDNIVAEQLLIALILSKQLSNEPTDYIRTACLARMNTTWNKQHFFLDVIFEPSFPSPFGNSQQRHSQSCNAMGQNINFDIRRFLKLLYLFEQFAVSVRRNQTNEGLLFWLKLNLKSNFVSFLSLRFSADLLIQRFPSARRVKRLNVYFLPSVDQSEPSGDVADVNFDSFWLFLMVDGFEIEPTSVASSVSINSQMNVILIFCHF